MGTVLPPFGPSPHQESLAGCAQMVLGPLFGPFLVPFLNILGPRLKWAHPPLSGGLSALQPEGDVSRNGKRDREAEQAAGQDWRKD